MKGFVKAKRSANQKAPWHLKNQVPWCIIYLESESDLTPICPQLSETIKNSILHIEP